MALGGKDFFTVIEFGTSKISAVHCRIVRNGPPEIAGFATAESAGSIIKGDLMEVPRAEKILSDVLAKADNSAATVCDRENVYCLISGRGISSLRGNGNINLYENDNLITLEHIEEAQCKAMNVPIPPNMIDIDSFNSAFMLDMNTRVRDPLNHTANRLDAYVHIILAEKNRLDTIRTVLRDVGFEGKINFIFTGVAAAYGTLTRDEKESGALLLDFGAGTLDYMAVVGDGVMASGVIPVGTDNIANDLSIGLKISFEQAKKILVSGRIDELRKSGEAFLENQGLDSAIPRRIPIASFEKIIHARLQETFSILKEKLDEADLLPSLQAGIVMTGGGAMFPAAAENASGILGLHKRIAKPLELAGAPAEAYNTRFSALLGSLQYISELSSADGTNFPLGKMANVFENLAGGLMNKMKNVTKVFTKI